MYLIVTYVQGHVRIFVFSCSAQGFHNARLGLRLGLGLGSFLVEGETVWERGQYQ